MTAASSIRVLCAEDNKLVADAIGRKLSGDPSFTWLGWTSTKEDLLAKAKEHSPDVVCMDLDMPGQDPFDMIRALQTCCPNTRVLILTGHVRPDLIDMSFQAGAWGFLSKAEESQVIIDSIRRVAAGSFVLGDLSAAYHPQRAEQIPMPTPPEPKGGFSQWTRSILNFLGWRKESATGGSDNPNQHGAIAAGMAPEVQVRLAKHTPEKPGRSE